MRFNQIRKEVKDCLDCNIPVLLLGDAGIGKSSFLKAVTDHATSPVFTLCVNQLADRADLSGIRLVPTGKKDASGRDDYAQRFFPHATILACINYANANPTHAPILFLDEINRAGSDITSYALSFITERAVGDRKIPGNVRFVFAGNHKGNVTAMDDASLTRFARFYVEPDLDTFLEVNPDLHPYIKEVLTANPDCLDCRPVHEIDAGTDDDGDDSVPDSIDSLFAEDHSFDQMAVPRTISALSEYLRRKSPEDFMAMVRESTLEPILEAFTGETRFTNLLTALIAEKLSAGIPAMQANTLARPARYDSFRNLTTIQDMESMAASMLPAERCQMIAYALCEHVDNRNMITALSNGLANTTQADIQPIMQAVSSGNLDPDNAHAFTATAPQSPVATMFTAFIA